MSSYQSFQIRCRVLSACFASLASRASVAGQYLVAHRARCYGAQAAFPSHMTEAQLRAVFRELSASIS